MHFCMEVAEKAIIIDRGKAVRIFKFKSLTERKLRRDKYLAI